MKKADLIRALSAEIPLQPERTLKGPAQEETDALRFVRDHGWSVPEGEFTDRFDDDYDVAPGWPWHSPASTMGRLRSLGFPGEAVVHGRNHVVIPKELREGLTKLLEREGLVSVPASRTWFFRRLFPLRTDIHTRLRAPFTLTSKKIEFTLKFYRCCHQSGGSGRRSADSVGL